MCGLRSGSLVKIRREKMKRNFKNYSIELLESSIAIYIGELKWFELPVSSAVDTDIEDDDFEMINHTVSEEKSSVTAEYFTSSRLWEEKIYKIRAAEDGFHYTVTVKGQGKINKIRYFTNSRQKVFYEAAGYLLPKAEHRNHSDSIYDICKDNTLDSWYFAPPPFVYPFFAEGEEGWFGLGLAVKPGEYNFDVFNYKAPLRLELPLYSRTEVNGTKELQGIWGGFGKSDTEVVKNYSKWHYDTGLCVQRNYENDPVWWRQPIFCGWGEQQYLSEHSSDKTRVPSTFARQEEYERMVRTLEEKNIPYGTLIIDAKWQEKFGNPVVDTERWHNMRAFVDMLHSKGKRVLLWIKSWDPEGLTREEGVQLLCNLIAADPTNPLYRDRMKKNIRHMLSDENGCLNCDGFKIDFINCFPKGESIKTHKPGIYGVELIRAWLEFVYTEAKKIKPDALINASCAHPYMADVIDQMRLHDYDGKMRSVNSIMGYRAELVQAVYPGISIDCDAGGAGTHRDFMRYAEYQPQIGIPDLYVLSGTEEGDFTDEDYNRIGELRAEYIKKKI